MTAPKEEGMVVVAGLFGLIGGGVSYVAYDYRFLGALMIAVLIALIVFVVLWFGWRDADPVKANSPRDVNGTAPTASAPIATDVVAPAEVNAPATVATAPAPVTTAPVAAAPAAAKVKPSTVLPGEAELAARKGDWKYEADAAPAAAEPAKAKPAPKAKPKPKAKSKPAPVAADAGEGTKPVMLTAARDGGPDDLKQIKGVGPKLEGMLHEMGVYHFDQVGSWGASEVSWMDNNLKGFKGRVSRDEWIDQAKVLAAGGTTEFSKKVDKGGVY